MQRIDGADVAAIRPADPADNAPGWFQQGDVTIPKLATVVTFTWLNDVQNEIEGIATLRGVALSSADSNQAKTAVEAVQALDASATDTGVVTSYWRRAVLASSRSQASGADSAVLASGDASGASLSDATGTRTVVIACDRGRVYPSSQQGATIASTFARVDSGGGGGANQTMIACAGGTVDGSQAAAMCATNAVVSHDNCLATGISPASEIDGSRVHSSGEISLATGKLCQFSEFTMVAETLNAGPTFAIMGGNYTFTSDGTYLIDWMIGARQNGAGALDCWGTSGTRLVRFDGANTFLIGTINAGTPRGSAAALTDCSVTLAAVGATVTWTVNQNAYANNMNWGGYFKVLRIDG